MNSIGIPNTSCGMCYPVWDDAYKRTRGANRKE